jgi:hypothetical protein
MGRRQPERHLRRLDALLCPTDALTHGGLGDQERTRDLSGRQAADGTQSQRDLRCGRELGMAAQEQQDKRVIPLGRRSIGSGRGQAVTGNPGGDGVFTTTPRLGAAQLVGHPAVRDRDEPATRVLRHAGLTPLHGSSEQRLLHGVLGSVEVSEPANE